MKEFINEIWHVTGERLIMRWHFYSGMYLEDAKTGETYRLGRISRWTTLSPGQQESICRGLNREHWLVLLGLDPPDDD